MRFNLTRLRGFTLIQMSVILTVAALAMVAILPGYQNTNNANGVSANKMNTVMSALRQYEVTHGNLPCPADPTIAIGNSGYGMAYTNGGTGSGNNCVNSAAPYTPYADTTKNIAIGMVPVRTLGLSYDAALDGYDRDISYVVDTNATGCWGTATLPGAVTVTDNGILQNTVVALVSHGVDGYGAWLPAQGTGITGTGQRLNNGSTDTAEAANAEVATGGGLTALTAGNFVNLVNQPATNTFDDLVIYKSRLFNLNSLPINNANPIITSVPSNNNYSNPNTLNFSVTFPQTITVNLGGGAPYLTLTSLNCSSSTSIGGSGGCNAAGQATYQSGSNSTTLTFQYTVGASDNAPSGIAVSGNITVPSGSSVTGDASLCLIGESLPGVILQPSPVFYLSDYSNNRVVALSQTTGAYQNFTISNGGTFNTTLNTPMSIATDSSGNIWIMDEGNGRILKFSNSGAWLMTIGGVYTNKCAGYAGTGSNCTSGVCYISAYDGTHNSTPCPLNGTSSNCSCSQYGTSNGEFSWGGSPNQMAFDSSGNLWVTDAGNARIQEFNSTTGAFITSWPVKVTSTVTAVPSGLAVTGTGASTTIWVMVAGQKISGTYYCGPYEFPPSGGVGTAPTGTGCGTSSNQFNKTGQSAQDSDYLSVDNNGNLWANDEGQNYIHGFTITGTCPSSCYAAYSANLKGPSANSLSGITGACFVPNSTTSVWVSSESSQDLYLLNDSTGALITTVTSANGSSFNAPQISYSKAR